MPEVKSVTSNQEVERAKNAPKSELERLQLEEARHKAEAARIQSELAQQQLELQKQQLEELKRKNAEAKQQQEWKESHAAQTRKRDEQAKLIDKIKQEGCNHKNGGEGIEGLYQGDDSNYAINAEFNLLGEKDYRCVRCDHTWVQPKRNGVDDWGKKFATDAEFEAYKALYTQVSKYPHKGFKPSVPVTFTVPGKNAPLGGVPAVAPVAQASDALAE